MNDSELGLHLGAAIITIAARSAILSKRSHKLPLRAVAMRTSALAGLTLTFEGRS